MSATRYIFRRTEAADGPALNRLYCDFTGAARSLEQYAWEWRDGPDGPAPSWVIAVEATGEIVGHHGVVPTPLSRRGVAVRAARTENSMVAAAHRGRFIYSAFEAQALRELSGKFDIIFTTAAGGNPGVVRRRLGYVEIGAWRVTTARAGLRYLAGRLFRGARGGRARGELESIDHREAARLWAAWAPAYPLAPSRDAAHLEWRIVRNPYHRFHIVCIREAGEPVGVAIWRRRETDGAVDLWLEDIYVAGREEQNYIRVLNGLYREHAAEPSRVLVRKLHTDDPLGRAVARLSPFWARHDRGAGSPMMARFFDVELAAEPWATTMLLSEGV